MCAHFVYVSETHIIKTSLDLCTGFTGVSMVIQTLGKFELSDKHAFYFMIPPFLRMRLNSGIKTHVYRYSERVLIRCYDLRNRFYSQRSYKLIWVVPLVLLLGVQKMDPNT